MGRGRKQREIEYEVNEKGCHIITSHALDKNGYGKIGRNGRWWQAHRYVYTQIHGEIPKGLVLMHSCDNPSCINPEHLSLGTPKDNTQDMIEKGRTLVVGTGSGSHPYGQLKTGNDSVVAQLRIAKDLTQKELAELVGIKQPSLARIESGARGASVKVLKNIASVLNVSIDELLKTKTN